MPWIGIYPVVSVFVWSFQQDRHERGGPECGVRLSDVVASALGHSRLVRGGVGTCLPGRPEAANLPPQRALAVGLGWPRVSSARVSFSLRASWGDGGCWDRVFKTVCSKELWERATRLFTEACRGRG